MMYPKLLLFLLLLLLVLVLLGFVLALLVFAVPFRVVVAILLGSICAVVQT